MLANASFEAMVVRVIVIAVFLLVAFPIHEFSHALAAYRLGDSTARLFGRLTLNPIVHFDPIGGSLLAITLLLGSGLAFGWAKPTPVNPRNLQGGRWGEAIVAAAGPISNLVLAVVAALPLRYMLAAGMDLPLVEEALALLVSINLLLMVFNLIPVPPLDGGAVLFAFLPPQTAWQLRPILAQYGLVILILLIFPIFGGTSLLGEIITSVVGPLYSLLTGL
ncbi:MAG TPA: site-2 protease family protein [Candidatus Limnocylindrales bacterium]|nr:site-2 protease family protein [Candidatus Limnocylindrales bacterium]